MGSPNPLLDAQETLPESGSKSGVNSADLKVAAPVTNRKRNSSSDEEQSSHGSVSSFEQAGKSWEDVLASMQDTEPTDGAPQSQKKNALHRANYTVSKEFRKSISDESKSTRAAVIGFAKKAGSAFAAGFSSFGKFLNNNRRLIFWLLVVGACALILFVPVVGQLLGLAGIIKFFVAQTIYTIAAHFPYMSFFATVTGAPAALLSLAAIGTALALNLDRFLDRFCRAITRPARVFYDIYTTGNFDDNKFLKNAARMAAEFFALAYLITVPLKIVATFLHVTFSALTFKWKTSNETSANEILGLNNRNLRDWTGLFVPRAFHAVARFLGVLAFIFASLAYSLHSISPEKGFFNRLLGFFSRILILPSLVFVGLSIAIRDACCNSGCAYTSARFFKMAEQMRTNLPNVWSEVWRVRSLEKDAKGSITKISQTREFPSERGSSTESPENRTTTAGLLSAMPAGAAVGGVTDDAPAAAVTAMPASPQPLPFAQAVTNAAPESPPESPKQGEHQSSDPEAFPQLGRSSSDSSA
jgi:hypothetical protein